MAGADLNQVVTRGVDRARFERCKSVRHWLVYGAGSTGRKWASTLAGDGRTVHAFVDRQAVGGGQVPIFKPDDCPEKLKRDCAVLVALHNPGVDVSAVKHSLLKEGYRDVWLLQELIDTWPERSHFWLASSQESLPFLDDVRSAYDALADDQSRRLFVALLDQRLNGAADSLPPPDPAHTYFPPDLPWPNVPLRFIDCGAYTGDTVDSFRRNGFRFEGIAAFEPDANHYPKLCAAVARERACVFPCGVWDQMTQLRFVADDAASRISEDGSIMVQTIALDQALPNFGPNFIKMDIEGAESKALAGAKGLISQHRPRLAISAYHKPRDLWELLLLIKRWDLAYEFHLRSHSFNGFDTVLYGLPRS